MERHVRKSEKIVGGGRREGGREGRRKGGRDRVCCEEREREAEIGKGRERVVREWREGGRGRRSDRLEKCGDIAAERMV